MMGVMPDIITKRFEQADEVREFELGRFDIVHLAGVALGRAEYAPGWRWTTHVGAITGEALCQVEHVCLVLEGHAAVRMADGTERVFGPGDAFYVPLKEFRYPPIVVDA